MSLTRALRPSYVVLPHDETRFDTVIAFLMAKFPQIEAGVWRARVVDGKVSWADGSLVTLECQFKPREKVYYYREVETETKIPFVEKILFQDDNIIIAYKPHFLGVSPSGNFVNECLTHRLCARIGKDTVAPAHRLDRDTAGVILMTINPEVRHPYHELFKTGSITKEYQALAKLTPELNSLYEEGKLSLPQHWTVKNRMVKGEPSFRMQVVEGEANTHSEISLIKVVDGIGLFALSPVTGKTHQLRVHMLSLGMPLLNDRFYPELAPKGPDNFDKPLALIAKRLSFIDPISQQTHQVECQGFTGFED